MIEGNLLTPGQNNSSQNSTIKTIEMNSELPEKQRNIVPIDCKRNRSPPVKRKLTTALGRDRNSNVVDKVKGWTIVSMRQNSHIA